MNKYSLGENSPETQRKIIFNEMLKGRRVSQLNVTYEFGFTRLSAIIFDIKKKIKDDNTLVVKDEVITGVNRYGKKCRFKEYFLERV